MTHAEIQKLILWIPNYNGEFDNPENYNYIKPYFEKGTSLNKILEKVFNFPLEHPSIDHETKTITMDLWSGRQLLSLIIPKIKMIKKNSQYDNVPEQEKYQNIIKINNDRYTDGVMDKNILGNKSQGIIHIINNDLGYREAQSFLDNIQNIITNWMITYGFSVGMSDLVPNDTAQKNMKQIIEEKKQK